MTLEKEHDKAKLCRELDVIITMSMSCMMEMWVLVKVSDSTVHSMYPAAKQTSLWRVV